MAAVLKYISDLADTRDALAIEYIADAARHSLATAKSMQEPRAE